MSKMTKSYNIDKTIISIILIGFIVLGLGNLARSEEEYVMTAGFMVLIASFFLGKIYGQKDKKKNG